MWVSFCTIKNFSIATLRRRLTACRQNTRSITLRTNTVRIQDLRTSSIQTLSQTVSVQTNDSGDTFGDSFQQRPKSKKKKVSSSFRNKVNQSDGFIGKKPGLAIRRASVSGSNSIEMGQKRVLKFGGNAKSATMIRSAKREIQAETADEFGTFGKTTDKIEQITNLRSMKDYQTRKLPGLATERIEERYQNTIEPDFSDSDDEDLISVVPFRSKTYDPMWYAEKCGALIKQNKLVEAVAMLEKRMIKEDRIHPVFENFQILLTALGRAGYCKKAFDLFTLMGQKHVDPKKYTFTSLWNACANSQDKQIALEKAKWLLDHLERKAILLERIHYHALIKVFGRHGDLESAFKLVDRMIKEKLFPDADTFCHLLQGCISDKETGFKLAIEIWRKMMSHRCRPTLMSFNLLLRACRDCGLGSPEFASELLNAPSTLSSVEPKLRNPNSERPKRDFTTLNVEPQTTQTTASSIDPIWRIIAYSFNMDTVHLSEEGNPQILTAVDRAKEQSNALNWGNNLLSPSFELGTGEIVSLTETSKPQDKFVLIGGVRGILALMRRSGVKRDIKTFGQMLDLIPETRKSEEALLSYMDWAGVKGDVDFFNLMIKRRCGRREREGALTLLATFRERKLVPNERTFGCLAINCESRFEAAEMLRDMMALGVKGNIVIFGTLLKSAINVRNFGYALDVLKEIKYAGISPDQHFLRIVEHQIKSARESFSQASIEGKNESYLNQDGVQEGFLNFLSFYNNWLKQAELSKKENKERAMEKQIEEINTDDLRDPWDKPWAYQQLKYE